MSGSTIGGVVGGAIGFWVGGPAGAQWGWMIGSAVGGYVDPDIIEGPKLTDPQQQTANEGAPIPLIYGTGAVLGTIIQCQSVPTQHVTKQRTGKGGPVQKTYTYTRTVAIAICQAAPLGGEMRLRRAWVNGKLAYDASGSGFIDAESWKFLEGMRFYSGSETQTPDSALEALPAVDGGGVGNVPSYRGLCYAVLPACDVTDSRGAVPVIKWEVVSSGTSTASCTDIYNDAMFYYPLDDAGRNGTARELINGNDGTYSDTDGVGNGGPLRAGSLGSFNMATINDTMVADLDANWADATVVDRTEWTVCCYFAQTEDDGGSVARNVASFWQSPQFGYADWSLGLTTTSIPFGTYSDGATIGRPVSATGPAGGSFLMMTYKENGDGTATQTLYLNGLQAGTETRALPAERPGRQGRWITIGGGEYPDSGGFIGSVSDVAGWSRCFTAQEALEAYQGFEDFIALPDLEGGYVDPATGRLIGGCIDLVEAGMLDLADVVEDLIKRSTITDYDVSALAGIPVRGFPITQPTSAGAALKELQKVYFFDLPEWGNSGETYVKLRAVPRGGSTVFTLTDDDLVDVEDDEDTRTQQVEFARVVNFIASDPDHNYDPIKQTSERYSENIKADSEITISTAVVFDRDEAAQRADIFQKIQWEEASGKIVRTVPEEFTRYVPSDTGVVDGRRYRIESVDLQDGTCKWELTRDRIKAYVSDVTGSTGVALPDPVRSLIGPTLFQALNLPRLSTKDNSPGMYIFVCGLEQFPGWEGCDLYMSVDGGLTEQLVATIINPATMGWLTSDLNVGGSMLAVQLYNDDPLDSATDAQLAARMNAAAVTSGGVSEVLQFKIATDTGDKAYDLTTLTRGELGTTEGDHATDDDFVLLDGSQYFLPIDVSLAGQTLIFRPVSRGTTPANNATYSVVFDPQFTGPSSFDFYTDASGEKYADASGAFYYRD